MEVRIDAKTFSAADARALGIDVGDFIFLNPRVEIATGFIRSRHLDDKSGVAVIYGALIALRDAGLQPAQDTTSPNHQIQRWARRLRRLPRRPRPKILTIDMAAIGEGQNSTEYDVTICVKDSSGPYHFLMNDELRRIAANTASRIGRTSTRFTARMGRRIGARGDGARRLDRAGRRGVARLRAHAHGRAHAQHRSAGALSARSSGLRTDRTEG